MIATEAAISLVPRTWAVYRDGDYLGLVGLYGESWRAHGVGLLDGSPVAFTSRDEAVEWLLEQGAGS